MRRTTLFLAALAALALASPAGAKTWTVFGGSPEKKPPKGWPKAAFGEQFYPAKITVQAGDKVIFKTFEGHTVTFIKLGEFNFAVPDAAGSTYAGITDAAGQPFYFNGMAKWIFDAEQLLQPTGDKAIDDLEVHNRLIFGAESPGEKGQSATYVFPEPGTYRYVCLFHNFMHGTIVVKPKAATVPTATDVKADVAAQIDRNLKEVKALVPITPSEANTVFAGVATSTQMSLIAFVPKTLTVPDGTTVTWINRSPQQQHNVVFGPRDWLKPFEEQNELFPFGPPGTPNQVGPWNVYGTDPVDPATGAYAYDGAIHGNGVLMTMLFDGIASESADYLPIAFPDRVQVTFTKPGAYHYYCQIHGPEMSGDIVATG